MVSNGLLCKVSKGKFYKPKETLFGTLKPSVSEIVKDFLTKDGRTIGYISGTAAFAQMGIMTQISSAIIVGTNKYRRPLKRGEYSVSFLLQPNTIIEEEIPLYRILDAIRLVRDVPATSPDECVLAISRLISVLNLDERQRLCELAVAYTPYVRALLGAILESLSFSTEGLRNSLNGVSTYKLGISASTLSTLKNWNIV